MRRGRAVARTTALPSSHTPASITLLGAVSTLACTSPLPPPNGTIAHEARADLAAAPPSALLLLSLAAAAGPSSGTGVLEWVCLGGDCWPGLDYSCSSFFHAL